MSSRMGIITDAKQREAILLRAKKKLSNLYNTTMLKKAQESERARQAEVQQQLVEEQADNIMRDDVATFKTVATELQKPLRQQLSCFLDTVPDRLLFLA